MEFVLRPRGDGEWRRRRRSVCPIKANLYCCQPGGRGARIGSLLLPSSFLVMPCSKKKEERDFPFPGVAKKSLSSFLFFLFSVWGIPLPPPPPKKRTNTQQASLLGQAFAHICPQFESFSPPKANSCRNPSQPEKEEPSKQSTSFRTILLTPFFPLCSLPIW